MIELLILIVINSLAICGLYLATQDGMVLDWFENLAYKYANRLYPAICGCITCMASIWSLPYWYFYSDFIQWILYVFSLAGLNTILYNKYLDDGK